MRRRHDLWRYRELLPVLDEANVVTLGEGGTPLLPLHRLGPQLGLRHLYLKEEGINPTGTFKARGLAMAVSKAKELGLQNLPSPSPATPAVPWPLMLRQQGLKHTSSLPTTPRR